MAILLGVLTTTSAVGLVAAAAYVISYAALRPSIAVLQVAIVGVRFFGISRAVFRYLERLTSHSVNLNLLQKIRCWFFQKVEPLVPAGLSRYRTGDLLTQAIADVDSMENLYVRVFSPFFASLAITACISIFFGVYNPRLGWIIAGWLLAAILSLPLSGFFLGVRGGKALIGDRQTLNTMMIDALEGLEDLRIFQAEQKFFTSITNQELRCAKRDRNLGRNIALINGLSLGIANFGMIMILWEGGQLVINGQISGISLGVLVLSTLAVFEVMAPLVQASSLIGMSLEAGRRLFAITDQKPSVPQLDGIEAPIKSEAICITNLKFYYPGRVKPALDEISLELYPGKKVGLVGGSGSGKSTLINLLERYWDILPGMIRIGKTDIRDISPEVVRTLFSVVTPDAYIFSESLRMNLMIGNSETDIVDMNRILKALGLDSLVQRLPDGLNNWLGEQGQQISGGERQRIILSRALLRTAPYLLLDEPCSNLDIITEKQILEYIFYHYQDRGILLVTHNLVGMDRMDEILVLDQGKVIERGTHLELLHRNGYYAQMWRSQQDMISRLG